MIAFDEIVCRDLPAALRREWLESNGLGGFASSTLPGLNTRRYHGLLIAATQPPVGRVLLLSKLEETLVVDGRRYELGANQYPGVVHPEGYQYLRGFRLDPWPVWTYEAGGRRLGKRVFMVHGENTTVIEYFLDGPAAGVRLELRPLIAFRDFHGTTHENPALDPTVAPAPGGLGLRPYHGLPALYLAHNAAAVASDGYWYRRFQYERERERGLDWEEDLFNPCTLVFEPVTEKPATVIASTSPHEAGEAEALAARERRRRGAVAAGLRLPSPAGSTLALAADHFLAACGEHLTLLAGYPWFADWGRDTMIALPALVLAAGRYDAARSILQEFSRQVSEGMVPNRFPESGRQPEYNTADATLWYFQAVSAYLAASGDWATVRADFYPVLLEIVRWHLRGTRYGIYVEPETGLLHTGEPGVQLTWMDAKAGDWVVTPRAGKPVEIQALWHNALCIARDLAERAQDQSNRQRFERMAALAQESFQRLFWNEAAGCLYDVVDAAPDPSLRPNQVLAVSLPHPLLPLERARRVVEVVERELLTPFGLRTLARSDPHYVGRYEGDERARAAAYHQGSVWPWLLAPFVIACRKTRAGEPGLRQRLEALVRPLLDLMQDAGVGQLPELFDGDPPHQARGCIAQAWSVAALIGCLQEGTGCEG